MSNQKDCCKVINAKDNNNGCCPKLPLPQLVCHYTVNTENEKMKNKLSCSRDNGSDKDENNILAGDAHNKDNERDECGKEDRGGMEGGVRCREDRMRERALNGWKRLRWKTKRSRGQGWWSFRVQSGGLSYAHAGLWLGSLTLREAVQLHQSPLQDSPKKTEEDTAKP